MCYAAPGPRCSGHARKDLERAQSAHDKAINAVAEAETAMQAKGLDHAAQQADPDYRKAFEAALATEKGLQQAVADYDATPAGIKELKAQAAQIRQDVGPAAVTDPGHQAVMARLTAGQDRRAEALGLYKIFHRKDILRGEAEPDGGADSVADEKAALEPAPACTCIEYKYKSECEHIAPDRARTELLPTGAEASKDLHAANADLRQAQARYDEVAGTFKAAGQDLRTSTAVKQARQRLSEARAVVNTAEQRFYETPEGQAYLRRKADRIQGANGSARDASSLRLSAEEGRWRRTQNTATYATVTGTDAPAEAVSKHPLPAYGIGCSKECDDFAWTGNCADVNSKPAGGEALATTISAPVRIPAQRRGAMAWLRERISR